MRLWQKAGPESADDYDDDHYDNAGDGEDDDHGHHDPGSTAAKSWPITKSCKNLLPLTLTHLTPDLPAPNFDSRVYFANWTMSDPLPNNVRTPALPYNYNYNYNYKYKPDNFRVFRGRPQARIVNVPL